MDWTATLFADAFGSPFVSEWERNPQSLSLAVMYTGGSLRDFRLEGSVTSRDRGVVVRGRSPLFTMAPGPTTRSFGVRDLLEWELVAQQAAVEQTLRAGVIEEDDYEICVRVVSPEDIQLAEACGETSILYPEKPELLFPGPGGEVGAIQPTFQWTPVQVPPAVGATYRLRIVERHRGQLPATALESNRAWFEQDLPGTTPVLTYPVDALPLRPGQEYVWQVEVLDGSGRPLLPGGVESEIWPFTVGDLTATDPADEPEGGAGLLPDRLVLIPGFAQLRGLREADVRRTPGGWRVDGDARLELAGPYTTRLRARLEGLVLQGGADQPQVVSGRVVADGLGEVSLPGLPDGVLSLDGLTWEPAAGLTASAELTLPGAQTVPLEGRLTLNNAGVFGSARADLASGEAVRLEAEPVALRVDEVVVELPGGLSLNAGVELFGEASSCGRVGGRVDASGLLSAQVACGPDVRVPLVPGEAGTAGPHLALESLMGTLEADLSGGSFSYDLDLETGLEAAADVSSCRVWTSLTLASAADAPVGSLDVSRLEPRCGMAENELELGWLELGLRNLAVQRLGWSAEEGFDLQATVDLLPDVPALEGLDLPTLEDVGLGTEGLGVPRLELPAFSAGVAAAGWALDVRRLATEGFVLPWSEVALGEAGPASFLLEADLRFPDLADGMAPCLGDGVPLGRAELADGALELQVASGRLGPDCALALGDGFRMELEEVSGAARVALDGTPRVSEPLSVRGTAVLGAPLACPASGPDRDRIPLSVGLLPDGRVVGEIPDFVPSCPLALGPARVTVDRGALALEALGGGGQSALLTLTGRASLSPGGQSAEGRGELTVDLLTGEVASGSLTLDGPLELGLPFDDPLLSFRVDRATLSPAGVTVDGRSELLLPGDRTLGATFAQAVVAPDGSGLAGGEILFDGAFALDVGADPSQGIVSWTVTDAGAPLSFQTGVRLETPTQVVVDTAGLRSSGDASGRIVWEGRDLADLRSAFDGFAVGLDPVSVEAGLVELRDRGRDLLLAHLDARGFHPNLAYLVAGVVPDRLPLPTESVAYVQLRDGNGNLLVTTEQTGQGIRVHTNGGTLPLFLPALELGSGTVPQADVALDVTLDATDGSVVAGGFSTSIPSGTPGFDLSGLGVPLQVSGLSYPGQGVDPELVVEGLPVLPGGVEPADTVSLAVDGGGRLAGSFDLPLQGRLPLVEGSDLVALAYDRLQGSFDAELLGGRLDWNASLDGSLEVALGPGAPLTASATLDASPAGLSFSRVQLGGQVFSWFGVGGPLDVGLGGLTVPSISHDPVAGWDFAFQVDVDLRLPGHPELDLPPVEDVTFSPDGLALPALSIPDLGGASYTVGGFRVEGLAFRMDPVTLDPFDGVIPTDWGASFDLGISLDDLPQGAPPALAGLSLSVLDAGLDGGTFTGTVEPRTLTTPIDLPLGGGGMALALQSFTGSLFDDQGSQGVALEVEADLALPDFLACPAAGSTTVDLGSTTLTLRSDAGIEGTVPGFVPDCPVRWGPLELRATQADLVFSAGQSGQEVALDGAVTASLPGLAQGDTIRASGSVAVDLMGPSIASGSLAIAQPFELGLPVGNPLLTFQVPGGTLDPDGLTLAGQGELALGASQPAAVSFNDLLLDLAGLEIAGGSASIQGGFALDATFAQGLSWTARPLSQAPPQGQDGFRMEVPAGVTVDTQGLTVSGSSTASLVVQDTAFASLGLDFTGGFRFALDPLTVEAGRASFSLQQDEIAWLDPQGFQLGDLFALVPVPERLPLPTEDVAYLQLRDSQTDSALVESAEVTGGMEISTRQGEPVRLVIPGLDPGGGPPEVDVEFSVVVNTTTWEVVSGSVTAAAPGGGSLFGLDQTGLPLMARRVAYEATGQGRSLVVDARVDLPASLGDLAVDLTGLVVDAQGLSGTVSLGSFGQQWDGTSVATADLGAVGLQVDGAEAVFGQSPSLALDGGLLLDPFSDAQGNATALPFDADVSLGGVALQADPSALMGPLPLGLATFEPMAVGQDPAVGVTATASQLTVALGGVLRVPELDPSFAVTLSGLEVGTGGVSFPDISLPGQQDWQTFTLFGTTFTLKDLGQEPAIGLDWSQQLLLSLSGELAFLEQSLEFGGLEIGADGSIGLSGVGLLPQPVDIVEDHLVLAGLTVQNSRLEADLEVDLPAPFDGSGTQQVGFSVGTDGSVQGDGAVVMVDESPGIGGNRTQFEGPLATSHMRWLALDLAPDHGGPAELQMVGDVYLQGEADNRIQIGEKVNSSTDPGLAVGVDGSVTWGTVKIPQSFDFTFDALSLTVNPNAGSSLGGQGFQVSLSGQLTLDVPVVSGSLGFQDVRVGDGLEIDASNASVGSGGLAVAEVLSLQVDAFEYSPSPTTISVPDGAVPTGQSPDAQASSSGVAVSSYVRFGGTLSVGECGQGNSSDCLFSGGVDDFLAFRTAQANELNLIIQGASLSIPEMLDMTANFRYRQLQGGFEMVLGADATLLAQYDAAVVGAFEKSSGADLRAGLFVALDAPIPLVPGVLTLEGVGGGFFYNPKQSYLDLVRTQAAVPNLASSAYTTEPGRFTGLLYAQASIVDQAVVSARALLTVSETGAQIDGLAAFLSAQSDPQAAGLRGMMTLRVGFQEAFADGNVKLVVDYPHVETTGDGIDMGFYVYGTDSWGVFGDGGIEFLGGIMGGDAAFFFGNPGVYLEGSYRVDRDFWIIRLSADAQAAFWYLADESDWGAYLQLRAEAELAGGTISGSGTLRGALMAGSPLYVYAGARAEGCFMGACKSVDVHVKFRDGDLSGGFGYDDTMADIIARADGIRNRMMSARDDMASAVDEARPAPEDVSFSSDELAQAYLRLQDQSYSSITGQIGNAIWREGMYDSYYSMEQGFLDYQQWYRDLVAQTGAPTLSGSKEGWWYRQEIGSLLQEISDRQPTVVQQVQDIDAQIVQLQQSAAPSWPGSPVQSASFQAPTTTTTVDGSGVTHKTVTSGPGFQVDAGQADAARQTMTDREAQAQQLLQDARTQLDNLEAGLASVKAATTATSGDGSLLAFSELQADVVELAQEQYARQGDYLLRMQDWVRQKRPELQARRSEIRGYIQENDRRVREDITEPGLENLMDNVARHRAYSLSELADDPSILAQYEAAADQVSDESDPWYRQQADTLGMQLWYYLAEAGMQATDTALTSELDWLRGESGTRIGRMQRHHSQVTTDFHRLFESQAELEGLLYDLYGRYRTLLEGVGDTQELAVVDARLAELEADLETPAVQGVMAVSHPRSYMAEELFYITGSHPGDVYEYLYSSIRGGNVGFLGTLAMQSNGSEQMRKHWVLTPGRGTKSQDRTLRAGVRGGAGYLGLGRATYETRFEEAGDPQAQPSISSRISDTSPPSAPSISFAGYDARASNQYWSPYDDRLRVFFRAFDLQSGIAEYEYTVGTLQDTSAVRAWTSLGGRDEVNLLDLALSPDSAYYVRARVRNNEGLWSPVSTSDPVRVDASPPTWDDGARVTTALTTTLSMGGASTGGFIFGQQGDPYQDLNGAALPACEVSEPRHPHESLTAVFFGGVVLPAVGDPEVPEVTLRRPTATDDESGIGAHLWKVSSTPDTTWAPSESWNEAAGETFRVRGDPLDYDGDFYVSMVALNRAGIQSRGLVYGPFTPGDPTGPGTPDYCASATGSNPKLAARMDALAVDLETGVDGYEYRVREAGAGIVRGWPASEDWTVSSAPAVRNTETLGLQDGTEYYLDLRAVNGQGKTGETVTSGPVLADFSPPSRPGIGTLYVTDSNGRSLVLVQVSVPDDPHSGIMTLQWAIHEAGSDQPVVYGNVDGRSGAFWEALVDAQDNLLLQDGDYVLKLRSVNGLGRPSAILTRSFTVNSR